MEKITVSFIRENKKCVAGAGKSLLEIAGDNNINLCPGGCFAAKCGKCKVLITKGNDAFVTKEEKDILTDDEVAKGVRLACAFVPKADISVITLNENDDKEIVKQVNDGKNNARPVVVMDAGTTTLKLYVFDEDSVKIFAGDKDREHIPLVELSMDNPLRVFGSDVMTRINNGCNKERFLQMKNMLHDAIEKMLSCVRDDFAFDKFIIIGNTTMIHIAAGKSTDKLGKAPFYTGYMGGEYIKNYAFGNTDAYVARCIKGHVGADAHACLYAANQDGLIMDIGTNSEIMLLVNDKVYVCSAPAGPAFEETNIGCGMKRDKGAVVSIKEDGTSFGMYVDDGEGGLIYLKPDDYRCKDIKGLCAGAVIDLSAFMLKNGIIDEYGTFVTDEDYINVSSYCPNVKFTQKDVRSLQMGKAAVMAATSTLMYKAGIDNEKKGYLYLAGNFGSGMNAENAKYIGLIPVTDAQMIVPMGNMAAKGAAVMFVNLNNQYDEEKFIHVELTDEEYFKKKYIEEMNFTKNNISDKEA